LVSARGRSAAKGGLGFDGPGPFRAGEMLPASD